MNHRHSTAETSVEITQEEEQTLLQRIRGWLKSLLLFRPGSSLKETLEEVIEEHEERTEEQLPLEEKRMLHNVLSFGDIRASDIMTPRTDIAAVPSDISLLQLKNHIMRYRHTRIPVYRETLDQMQGFIHVKDLLPMFSGDMGFELKALLRNVLLVPPSMRLMDLLVKMRKSGTHLAIVVDEYGGTDGLVTLEDVFERIVGDIHDEHDAGKDEDLAVLRITDKIIEVSARIPIIVLEQQLGLNLVTEEKVGEFDTLGGLIFFTLGRVPAKGEIVPHTNGVRFEIIEADPRRIRKVRIIT